MVIDNIYDNRLSKSSNTFRIPLRKVSVSYCQNFDRDILETQKPEIKFYTKKEMTIKFQSRLHKATEFHLI